MNPAIYVAIFLPILIMIMNRRKRRRQIEEIIKKRKKGDTGEMLEFARALIGKECIIYLFDDTRHTGIIKEVSYGAILFEKKGEAQVLNLDYVVRIREFPKDKNGKKKSVFLD
jgi:hypothetical protein